MGKGQHVSKFLRKRKTEFTWSVARRRIPKDSLGIIFKNGWVRKGKAKKKFFQRGKNYCSLPQDGPDKGKLLESTARNGARVLLKTLKGQAKQRTRGAWGNTAVATAWEMGGQGTRGTLLILPGGNAERQGNHALEK